MTMLRTLRSLQTANLTWWQHQRHYGVKFSNRLSTGVRVLCGWNLDASDHDMYAVRADDMTVVSLIFWHQHLQHNVLSKGTNTAHVDRCPCHQSLYAAAGMGCEASHKLYPGFRAAKSTSPIITHVTGL